MTQPAHHRQNGGAIRRIRIERGIRTGELAQAVNVARITLTTIENGNRQAGWELLHRLKAQLDVPLETLLSDAGRAEFREQVKAS